MKKRNDHLTTRNSLKELREEAKKFYDSFSKQWIGLDGKRVSDDKLKAWEKDAIELEDYEYAAEIRDELEKRKEESK